MKACGAFVKFKFFVCSKPPIVLFTMALAILALGSACISMYIKNTDLTVDNATKSWDAFLENLSSQQFCINSTDAYHNQSLLFSPHPKVEIRSFTFPMVLTVQRPSRAALPHKLVLLTLVVDLIQFGFKSWPAGGSNGTGEDGTVEISVPIPLRSDLGNCSGDCNSRTAIRTCVTIRGPPSALPSSIVTQPICHVEVNSSDKSQYFAKLVAFDKSRNPSQCASDAMVSLNYQRNPALVVHYSLDDKYIINLHLFYTSFFLFVMVFMILTFALLRGKLSTHNKPSGVDGNACPDIKNGSIRDGDKEMLLDEL